MRADRLLRMLMLLERHRHLTAPVLAAELEVSQRTVLRDIEALAAAGVPVWTERGPGGGCHLMDGWHTRAAGLTAQEAQALFAWSARESNDQLGLGGPLASALAKVAAGAPAGAVSSAEDLGQVVLADRRRWFTGTDEVPFLPLLREAVAGRRRIRAEYRSASAAQPHGRLLDPVGLVDHSGRWYLVAEQAGQMRMFRVSRLVAVEVLEDLAQVEDRRPLARIWADLRAGFEADQREVEIVLAVGEEVADRFRRLIRMPLVPGTEIEVIPQDRGPDHWRVRVSKPDVVVAMAVMFAREVELLAPPHLRESVRQGARAALRRYDPPPGPAEVSGACDGVSP